MLTTLVQDLRIAVRSFLRQPVFTFTVVATLTISIGATTAIFSVVDAAVLRPVPFPHAARIMSIVHADPRFGYVGFAPPYLRDFRERARSFDSIAGFSSTWSMTLTGTGQPVVVPAAYVSDGLLDMFGAAPVAGRDFTADEHASGKGRVALVSESFWRQHFDRARLDGQLIRLDDTPYAVIGVLPDTFKMPITASAVSASTHAAEIWLPFAANEYAALRTVPVMNVVGRLKAGMGRAPLEAEMASISASLARDYPATSANDDVRVIPLSELVSRGVRRPLLLLLASVLMLLLIGCANVGNLLLARSAGRSGELAIRSSLGATRGRLAAQLLAESMALSVTGAIAGLALARLMIRLVPAIGFTELPPSATLAIDGRVVAFSIVASVATLLIIGLLPAVQVSGSAPARSLKDGVRTGDRGRRLRQTLVGAEVALALVLVIGAGLMARSFWTLTSVDPGFSGDRVLAGSLSLPATRYATAERRRAFAEEALARLSAMNGVEQAALVNRLPFAGGNVLVGVEFEGQTLPDGKPVSVDRRVVSPQYFSAMGIPVFAGRTFGSDDRAGSTGPVAIVNDALARRYWPNESAEGRRLRLLLRGGPGPWLRVVGVVGNVRHHGLDQAARPEVYVPYAQAAVEAFALIVRARDPASLGAVFRDEVQRLDPELPVRGIGVVSNAIETSLTEPRTRTFLFNAFAAIGLLLAALGIYGVVSYSVARSTKDICVRMALGAQRMDILRMIIGQNMTMVGIGVLLGLLTAYAVTRTLQGILFGVTPTDPLTFATVTALLFVVALVAAYLPARRAVRLDPVNALRVD